MSSGQRFLPSATASPWKRIPFSCETSSSSALSMSTLRMVIRISCRHAALVLAHTEISDPLLQGDVVLQLPTIDFDNLAPPARRGESCGPSPAKDPPGDVDGVH